MPDIDTKPTHKTQLYVDVQGGRVVCFDDLGFYGKSAVDADPSAGAWLTPLNFWTPVTADENDAWVRKFREPMACEDCGKGGPW